MSNPRAADYLFLHANVSRRVSNLETGVHPTRSEFGYGDSYGPTLVDVTSAILVPLMQGVTDAKLRWQRRMGITQLVGGLGFGPGKTHTHLPAGEVIGVLPAQARPLVPLRMQGQLSADPYVFQFTLDPDGTLTVLKPAGPVAGATYTFHFDGNSWTVN